MQDQVTDIVETYKRYLLQRVKRFFNAINTWITTTRDFKIMQI